MTSVYSLDHVLRQCARFGLTREETLSIKAVYVRVDDAYLALHLSPKSTAEQAFVVGREAERRAYKEAAASICALVDDLQRGS